jgi:hypothetical protein
VIGGSALGEIVAQNAIEAAQLRLLLSGNRFRKR